MNGFSRLALVEGKLFLREKAALIGVFGLPVALVIGFGLIPGFSDPQNAVRDSWMGIEARPEYLVIMAAWALVAATLAARFFRWDQA